MISLPLVVKIIQELYIAFITLHSFSGCVCTRIFKGIEKDTRKNSKYGPVLVVQSDSLNISKDMLHVDL